MNRVVGYEEGKRNATRAGEKGIAAKQKMRGSHATHSIVKGYFNPIYFCFFSSSFIFRFSG